MPRQKKQKPLSEKEKDKLTLAVMNMDWSKVTRDFRARIADVQEECRQRGIEAARKLREEHSNCPNNRWRPIRSHSNIRLLASLVPIHL